MNSLSLFHIGIGQAFYIVYDDDTGTGCGCSSNKFFFKQSGGFCRFGVLR